MKIQQDVAERKIFIFCCPAHYGAMQEQESVERLTPAGSKTACLLPCPARCQWLPPPSQCFPCPPLQSFPAAFCKWIPCRGDEPRKALCFHRSYPSVSCTSPSTFTDKVQTFSTMFSVSALGLASPKHLRIAFH